MDRIYVLWHKIPDTDAIVSSIVFAEYLQALWFDAEAYKLWEINNETRFLLDNVWVRVPETIKTLEPKSKIALVDHNEYTQTIDNIWELEMHFLVDHHKIWSLSTEYPLFIRTEPLCSTSSIVYKLMKSEWIIPSKTSAILMISAILSDSLHFRSPTTQEEDKHIVTRLNQIAWIQDIEKYALEMFNAKSDLWNITIEELIKLDYKEFDFNWKKAWIGTVETTNPGYSMNRKDEILKWLQDIKSRDWLDLILLSIVDILNEKNITFVIWEFEKKVIKDVFSIDTADNLADLWNRLSRKKQ
ncbi:MAG: hypothetical protein ACD_3C00073G0001, partial [uncultured bacterium (gcode 4)]